VARTCILSVLSVVLLSCATAVERQSAPAQPTRTFSEPWDEGGPVKAPAPVEDRPAAGIAPEERQSMEQPTEGAGETLLCCETATSVPGGTELVGCRTIEDGVSARNACIDGGKTLKSCKDTECSGRKCHCSN
jgi:hypothetical protein